MADVAGNKMVLRSLYLPLELDRVLRSLAFSRSMSKAELMRIFIENGLKNVKESGEKTLAERLSALSAVKMDEETVNKPKPEISIKKTVTPDYIISLEDGKQYKSLKRHLTTRGLSPDQYRQKWGLPHDYPMVAATYAAQRSELAKSTGLGQLRHNRAAQEAAQSTPKASRRRSRPKKAAEN